LILSLQLRPFEEARREALAALLFNPLRWQLPGLSERDVAEHLSCIRALRHLAVHTIEHSLTAVVAIDSVVPAPARREISSESRMREICMSGFVAAKTAK
jgi:hypothetical protein